MKAFESFRLLLVVLVACSLAWCTRRAGVRDVPTNEAASATKVIAKFDLLVESGDGFSRLLVRFPDHVNRIPRINSLSIGKLGEEHAFCALDVIDRNGKLLEGYWVVGSAPENYRSEGCRERSLSSGDYEVVVWTQRGEDRRRLHVDDKGLVVVSPWETGEDIEAAARFNAPF
jgi:hypothetical protein